VGASPLDVFRQDRVRLPAAESKQDCGHPGLTKLLAGSGVPPGGPRVEVHCHFVNFTPDNRFLIATDTGLNKVFIHRIDAANGTFIARDPPFLGLQHQASPRQFRFHSNGKWAYIANESGPGCTMLGYDTRRGVFEEGPTGRTVPESYREWMTCAEVEVHPSGEFVYVSNRGHNSIPAMSIDQSTGAPSLIEAFPLGGNNPRSFNIDPTGGYLFAMLQRSDVIVPLRIDRRSADYRDLARTFHYLRLCARSLVEIS
jgi:6-phosphogluconolactonase